MKKQRVTLQTVLTAVQGMEKRFEERFDGIDKRLDGMDERFDGIDKRLDGHDQQFKVLDKRITDESRQNRVLIEALDRKFESFAEANKVILDGYDKVLHHAKRIENIEREVFLIKKVLKTKEF